MSELDEIDAQIIKTLEQDSRTSFSEMAKAMSISEAGVRKRVIALQKKGVIKKFTIEIEAAKMGIYGVSIVGLDVDPTKLLEAIEKLCEFDEVRKLYASSGDHMIMMEVWTKDGRELTRFISEKIGPVEGVKKICPAIILEKYK